MSLQPTFKVVLIGDPMAGKTSLLTRLIRNHFNNNYLPTIGTGCEKWVTSNGVEKTQLQIWDTAGQEKYRSIGRMFYHNADAAVLVVNQSQIVDYQSMESWIKEFRNVVGESATIAVTASQSDLKSTETTGLYAWAQSMGLVVIETSAKTGQGVRALFEYIALDVKKNRYQIMSSPIELAVECRERFSGCC